MPDIAVDPGQVVPRETPARRRPRGLLALPVLLTALALVTAGLLAWAAWRAYMAAP